MVRSGNKNDASEAESWALCCCNHLLAAAHPHSYLRQRCSGPDATSESGAALDVDRVLCMPDRKLLPPPCHPLVRRALISHLCARRQLHFSSI